jgi:DNA-binding NtrC family response regulator
MANEPFMAGWIKPASQEMVEGTCFNPENDAKQIVVPMTTSESHISKVTAAMEAGANNDLVKPCDTPKLRQRLERALMRSLA